MFWPGFIALIAVTCMLVPLLLVRQRLLFRARVYAPPVPLHEIEQSLVENVSVTPSSPSRQGATHPDVLMGDTATKQLVQSAALYLVRPSNYIAPCDFTRRAFPYSIRRHRGSLTRHVADCGGYAEVPFLLHDHQGNGYTIYRRVSLN